MAAWSLTPHNLELEGLILQQASGPPWQDSYLTCQKLILEIARRPFRPCWQAWLLLQVCLNATEVLLPSLLQVCLNVLGVLLPSLLSRVW